MYSLDSFCICSYGFRNGADMYAFWPFRLVEHKMNNATRDGWKVRVLILDFRLMDLRSGVGRRRRPSAPSG